MIEKPSILVGQIWHEGHSFNPIKTTRDDFLFTRGDAILAEARASATALSGIVLEADALGYRCAPSFVARARPGGAVEQPVMEEIFENFVAAARKGGFEAICLDLRGATLADGYIDPEGELLKRLRAVVGHTMPISLALDLHGYLTDDIVQNATIITAFRTTPHSDIAETGSRAMALLDRLIRSGERPHAVRTLIPFLTRGNDETQSGPLVRIGRAANAWRGHSDIVDLSIFNVHPFLDVPHYDQVVLAYDNGEGAALSASRELSQMLWDARDEFVEQLISVEAALEIATSSDLPLASGDQGDRVVGAGPGDSPEIARIALESFPGLAVVVPVYDPQAVRVAMAAGEGAFVDLTVGGSATKSVRSLTRNWLVKKIGPARFINKGPYIAGAEADFGDAAVLVCEAVTVIVTSRAPNVHDPAFYDAMGVPVSSQKAVVARAANHYKLNFADCARTMTVDTLGLTAFRPHEFPFDLARPFHRLDQIEWRF